MRTATLVVLAVVAAAAVSSRVYGLQTGAHLSSQDHRPDYVGPANASSADVPVILAGDNLTSDAATGGTTAEIPQAEKQTDPDAQPAPEESTFGDPVTTSTDSSPDSQQVDDGAQGEMPSRVYSLQDFVNQGMEESPLGVELREDCSRLDDREKVCGLAVLEVRRGSPADQAGIKSYTALTHDLLDGASVAAALVFPPAIVAVAVLDQSGIGESFDLVIGVDGRRVRHVLDFEDLTSNLRPGDILYLTIVRSGKRLQIPVHVPAETVNAAAVN
jgi:hypothetical protein